jgi:hypothetical protein
MSPVTLAKEKNIRSKDQQTIIRVKSAFIYNFLKYVTFEQEENKVEFKELKVCMLGDDPFGAALDKISQRKAKGKKVLIKRTQSEKEVSDCHLVFISDSKKESLTQIFSELNQSSILTVSDIPGFVERGGVVGFVEVDKRIGLEINLSNARRANLRISALLLEIAKITE